MNLHGHIALLKHGSACIAVLFFVSCSDGSEQSRDPVSGQPLLAHDIDARRTHVCAVALDGSVWCWGRAGGEVSYRLPTRIEGVPARTKVANTDFDVCAWDSTGELFCWGDVTARYIDVNGMHVDPKTPLKIPNLPGVIAVAGDGQSLNAVDGAGGFWGWGLGADGQLALDPRQAFSSPTRASSVESARTTSTGCSYTCVVTTSGSVQCFGTMADGFPGGAPRGEPTTLPALEDIATLDVGCGHACAVSTSGRLSCWGRSTAGLLGRSGPGFPPAPVSGIGNVTSVAAADDHSCAVTSDGRVWCWGNNDLGQLGDGTDVAHTEPQLVSNLDDAIKVVAGVQFSCALKRDSSIWCWGNGFYFTLGSSRQSPQRVPERVLVP